MCPRRLWSRLSPFSLLLPPVRPRGMHACTHTGTRAHMCTHAWHQGLGFTPRSVTWDLPPNHWATGLALAFFREFFFPSGGTPRGPLCHDPP